jgi:hypothetical protein
MRIVLLILAVLALACARADDRQIRPKPTDESSIVTSRVSSTPPANQPPISLRDSSAPNKEPDITAGPKPTATFTGTAQDCFMRKTVPVGNLSISAFKVSNARPLVAHLDSMDKFAGFGIGDDATASAHFDIMQTAMQNMIVSTRALERTTSALDGTFAFTFSPVDSVLVAGFANMEEEPYVYAYKIIHGLADTSFILDMSRGDCGF